ncbi:MAG: hypothetical protein U9O55_03015, partial [Patescibacteria group bacterium]|nr:hypothetical protein [Patescibacteria group bacterium]
ACEYIDEAEIKNIGWQGYCLQYDRYPGDPKQCLLWWPVDLLLGEDANIKHGYNERYPLYYTTEGQIETRNVIGNKSWLFVDEFESLVDIELSLDDIGLGNINKEFFKLENINWIISRCNPHSGDPMYRFQEHGGVWDMNPSLDCRTAEGHLIFWNEPNPVISACGMSIEEIRNTVSNCPLGGDCMVMFWILDDYGRLDRYRYIIWDNGGDHLEPSCSTEINADIYYADKIAQVVTPIGQNKYWSGRVYEGSNYITIYPRVDMEHIIYNDDYLPFGSIVPPDPDYEPSLWDSKDETGIQRLYKEVPEEDLSSPYQPRAGQLHNTDSIKRLFAQSYGIWEWNGNNYESVEGFDWTPPENICFGDPPQRPIYNPITKTCGGGDCSAGCGNNPTGVTCDWCGVPPEITNINLNGMTGGDYKIGNSETINLRFNTIIDSNQLPLAMYAVDWGDGTDDKPNLILSSGVGTTSKPNPENQHSFYHLYGYWDMLNNNFGSNSIGCGAAGEGIDVDNDGVTDVLCDNFSSCCATKIKIKVKDNWGWCNSGTTRNDCESWEEYNGYIIVNQFGT